MSLHQQGHLPSAAVVYDELLQQQPDHEELLHLYSILSSQMGRYDIAIPLMQQILARYPQVAALHVNLGQAYQSNHQLNQAKMCYQQALVLDPLLPEAHNNLAGLLLKTDAWLAAKDHLMTALQHRQGYPEAWFNLGLWYEQNHDHSAAKQAYQQVLDYQPAHVKAWNRLGVLYQTEQQWEQSQKCFEQAFQLQPNHADTLHNWGLMLQAQKDYLGAKTKLLLALEHRPDYPEAWYHLGYVCQLNHEPEIAQEAYLKALELHPDYGQAWYNLGLLQCKQSQTIAAINSFHNALKLNFRPADVCYYLGELQQQMDQSAIIWFKRAVALYQVQKKINYCALGRAFKALHQYDQALSCFQKGLPDPEAVCEMGITLYFLKRYDEAHMWLTQAHEQGYENYYMYLGLAQLAAICGYTEQNFEYVQQAVALVPEDIHGPLGAIFALHGKPGITPLSLKAAYQKWEDQHLKPLYPDNPVFHNDRTPQRRLRIGYLSGDFYQHSASTVFSLLFDLHQRDAFEIYAYSTSPKVDALSIWFAEHTDQWLDVERWNERRLFHQIYQDQVDILVDLSGITSGNRLSVFARRAAPIQVTGLGYGSTTGVATMDYAFTDRYLVTPEHATLYCEKLYYLPSLICWTPTSDYLELPPLQPNHTHPDQIILGCGNATFKLNQQVIALWSQILHQLPHAVLHLKSQSFDYQICRSAFEQHFAQHGIDSNRLCLSGGTDIYHHMKFYNQVDIALDPFPYNGGITTCEILWMGVPVVTLGNQSLNRAGASILSQVGHPEWIARDEADYIGLVIELAQQTKKRAQLRTQLRQDMIASPLCDAVGYVREIESAYCYMWQQWCQQKGGGG